MKKKFIISLLVLCLGVLIFGVVITNAATYGDYTYEVSNDEVTITRIKASASGTIIIPSTIDGYPVTSVKASAFRYRTELTSVMIPDSVISIGNSAFYGCTGLTSVTIGDGNTSIGNSAFYGCTGLTSVTIGDGNTSIGDSAFKGCIGLSNVIIGNGVTSIGSSAFSGCAGVTSITLPDSVISIGNYAFEECVGLTNIRIGDGVTSIGYDVFNDTAYYNNTDNWYNDILYIDNHLIKVKTTISGEYKIKDGTLTIAGEAFESCTQLTSVILSDSLKSIGYEAFGGCNALTNIVIPDGVTRIGVGAFWGCNRLASIKMGESVTNIGRLAFQGCTSLRNFIIPDSTKSIGYDAFWGCNSLTNINVSENNINYCSIDGSLFSKDGSIIIIYPVGKRGTEYQIPASVTSIGNYAFYNNTKLTNVIIPDGVTSVGDYAFYGCTKLKDIYYSGTENDWNAISVGSNNTYFENANKHYIVTYKFVDEDGTVIFEKTVDYGTEIELPEEPSKEASQQYTYTFDGWEGYVAGMKATEDIVFTAKYTSSVRKYTCQFLNYDGTVVDQTMVPYGAEIKVPETTPVKATTQQYTYVFIGWDGYTEGLMVTENVVFIANYTAIVNQYTYKFVDEDGSVIFENTVDYGTEIELPEEPSKEATQQYTYIFVGWEGYKEGMTVAEDVVFAPKFTSIVNQYTYKFVDEDGTVILERAVDYGTEVELPEEPSKGGTQQYTYTFEGWVGYTAGTVVTEDVVFTAKYTPIVNQYTYRFIDDDGMIIFEKTVDYGTKIEYPGELSKASTSQYTYTFEGWEGYVDGLTVVRDIVFTAKYTAIVNQYTYQFVDEDGTIISKKIVDYGTEIELPEEPSKEGTQQYTYVFTGWDGYTEGLTVTEDVVFKANYTATVNQYTYKFVDEDGTVIFENTVDYGTEIELPEEPSKEATQQYTYTFVGWEGYAEGMTVTEDIVFMANFVEVVNQYTYKFVDEDGTVVLEKKVDYGTEIKLPKEPTKEETQQYTYTFVGWNGYIPGMTVSEDISFAAKYETTVNRYTYKFIDEDGTVVLEKKVDYGTKIEIPQVPADKDPYTFDYWQGYIEGMTITDDVTFSAVYKYKSYTISVDGNNEPITVTYNDSFVIEPQNRKDWIFKGYFTEKNGAGVKVTDENGNNLTPYNFIKDIAVYPYFEHSLLNKIEMVGAEEVYIGEQDVIQSVLFATDKDIMYLMGSIKFLEAMNLEKIESKDFVEIYEDSRITENGYTVVSFTGVYDYDGNFVPKSETINPFDLIFDVTTEMKAGAVTIEIIGVSMVGEETYEFEETICKTITILPKLAESVEIVGADEIDVPTQYTAIVLPDYTSDKRVEWAVDDENIATIDETGMLTPLKNGTVTITAMAKDGSGVFATKMVKVTAYAKINTLTSTMGIWNVEFDVDNREYVIYVKNDVTSITLTPTFSGGGVLRLNGSGIWVSNSAKTFNLSGDTTVITLNRQNVTNMTNSEYKVTVVKSENSVINASADKTMVEVFAVGAENGNVVIMALYNENRFVGMEKAFYDGQRIVFEPKVDYDSAKVMVWEDFETFMPVTEVENVEL